MRISELRNHPFLLLTLKDGEDEGLFSPELMQTIKQQLIDMSLRIASDNLSIIYADQIKKGCEIVLGITNLGLLSLCDNDSTKAKEIIKSEGIVYCFRAGWGKYAQLKKVSSKYFEGISITDYALGVNNMSDIASFHEGHMNQAYKSAKLLDVYKSMAEIYSASSLLIDTDEDVLLFELQRFLNSALALLIIDSDKKVFTSSLYETLNNYLLNTDKEQILDKIESSIVALKAQVPLVNRNYLQDIGIFDFNEFKGIINQQADVTLLIQEILELPITVAAELNDDFEGEYDFHSDDEDDIAYLRPDGL